MRTLSPAKHFNQVHLRRSPVYPVAVLLLCTQLIGGCSTTQNQRETEQLSIRASLDRLDTSIQQSTQASQLSALELSARIDKLEQRIQSQQAQIKALSKTQEVIRRQKHVARLHLSPPAKASQVPETKVTSIQAPTLVASTATESARSSEEAEKNAYTSAYLSLKSARYEEASKAFTAQIQAFPNGEYADQAWYWLGESQFSQNLNKQAIASFKHVIDKFPDSGKHAAAMLQLGQIYQATGEMNEARKYFNKLIHQHADSTAAEQARSALAAMQANAPTREK